VLGADFRAHDPGTEDDLALLRAHGWRLQPPLRRRAMPLGFRADAAKDAWARMLAFFKQYDVAGTATRAKAG
jgi:dienelactone hydrolase